MCGASCVTADQVYGEGQKHIFYVVNVVTLCLGNNSSAGGVLTRKSRLESCTIHTAFCYSFISAAMICLRHISYLSSIINPLSDAGANNCKSCCNTSSSLCVCVEVEVTVRAPKVQFELALCTLQQCKARCMPCLALRGNLS